MRRRTANGRPEISRKTKKLLPLLAALLLFASGLNASAPDAVEALNPLYGTLDADRFSVVVGWDSVRTPEVPLSLTTNVFNGFTADGKRIGTVVHLVTEGYGGTIAMLVGLDDEGTVTKVNIVNHSETECHIPGLSTGAMTERYRGLSLLDRIRLLVGTPKERPGDIEAISGATVSSRAVTEAVAEARIAFYLVRSSGLLEQP